MDIKQLPNKTAKQAATIAVMLITSKVIEVLSGHEVFLIIINAYGAYCTCTGTYTLIKEFRRRSSTSEFTQRKFTSLIKDEINNLACSALGI